MEDARGRSRKRTAGSGWLIWVGASLVTVLAGSFTQDWFPDTDPLLVSVVTGVVVGLALGVGVAVSTVLRRRRSSS